jgi:hypothetical protein
MTTTISGEPGQLTALRGAWLFDGTGAALIPDPVVVIEGSVIRDVCSGGRVPETPGSGTVIGRTSRGTGHRPARSPSATADPPCRPAREP